jgi:hypothetical protein
MYFMSFLLRTSVANCIEKSQRDFLWGGLDDFLDKLKLLLVGNVHNVTGLAGILGCGIVSSPLKYLGLLFGASYKAKHIWDDVIEKIECLCTSCPSFLSL